MKINTVEEIERAIELADVKAVAFSADGKYVISAASENEGSEDITMVVHRDLWNPREL